MPKRALVKSWFLAFCIAGSLITGCSVPPDPTVVLGASGFSPQAITIGQGQGSTEPFYIVNRTSSTKILCTLANGQCLATPDWTDGKEHPVGEYLRIPPGVTVTLTYPNATTYFVALADNPAQQLKVTETYNGGGEGG